ncbi:hypothetical protein [Neptunomonas antarctica]|uniref:hypothetical protein n=1 Tax=Neptunomonas antarctica TaxID=619304 RepID=UPI0006C7A56C|nr:hypothetical protein [Neptunomonas antarctica]
MSDELKYLSVALLVLFAFVPVTVQALKKRKQPTPPLASNDRKLYRLWRSDPDAYQRQYGALDVEYIKAQKSRSK